MIQIKKSLFYLLLTFRMNETVFQLNIHKI